MLVDKVFFIRLKFTILLLTPIIYLSQNQDSIIYVRGEKLNLINTITGKISPKSVVHNGFGLFFAQNMMYRHTITVYNRKQELIKTISDNIKLANYGYSNYRGSYKGAPVECAFSHNGKYAWVSNYEMSGGTSKEFSKPGCDGCSSKNRYDNSYIYKINTKTFLIEKVIEVGAVPKYIASTPNNKKILVTNWSSGDISIIDTKLNKEIKRLYLGRFPRGIVINKTSTIAYIAIMGSTKIAKLNLQNYSLSWIENIGKQPRHLCISNNDKTLYVSLNGESRVAKVNLKTNNIKKVYTGRLPRSMVLSKDDKFLYVVNYGSNEVVKLETSTMNIITKAKTKSKPIGITFDNKTKNIWTACYSGKIMVFHDTYYDSIAININERDRLLAINKNIKSNRISTQKLLEPIKNKKINGNYILVLGSFSTSAGARRRVLELTELGIKSKLYYNYKNNRNYAYVGAFKTREEAYKQSKFIEIENWIYKIPKKTKSSISIEKTINNTEKQINNFSYFVVCGSFKSKENAERKVNSLKLINKSAFVYYNKNNKYYYSCLSSFKTKELAIKYLKNTKEKGWVFNNNTNYNSE